MEPANFYSGIVVDAYAKLKSSTFEPGPYAEFVRAHGEPALEIGCGDGEPLLDLSALGLDVDGVDSSADMVERCRSNAAARGLPTQVFHQRAENLNLERTYASIYFAGPTFNLLPDDDTAAAALGAIERHLAGGGAALIPLWVPPPTSPEDLGSTRVALDDSGARLSYTPLRETYDRTGRTRTTSARYERTTNTGVEVADRDWIIHWHTPTSFADLCAAAGLRIVEMVDDDTYTDAHEDSTSFTATLQHR
ncbi:class I SAM-dependent methyltransferase [Solicola sp. PLA-1-18]|uniref:class I SAM-dependent methyltransferase n=1 Tax=Solicola sp. PLA-1-18 TaxID=3380532 RepID=UPI003B7712FB